MKHYEGDMALVGYALVSSVGQSIDVQLDKLKQCDKIYQKKKSGTGKRSKLEAHRREQGDLIKILMKDYNLSKASVYRYLGETNSDLSAQNA